MLDRKRCGKVNIKLVIILILVTAAVGVSLVVARQTHRGMLSTKSLALGETAWASQDWPSAAKNYRKYLSRNTDDVEVLRKYAEASLSIRPLDAAAVSGAISAYRRILELVPNDDVAYEKLAMLYGGVGNFDELAAIARERLEYDPNDRQAPLWLAEALSRLNKTAEARQVLVTFIEGLETRPEKYVEYVRACVQMSQLASGEASPPPKAPAAAESTPAPTALDWLNRAVTYAPDSAVALVSRAQFQRRMADMPDANEQDQTARRALARKDLEAADVKGTDDPRVRVVLGAEWIAHGELDRAAAELQAVDKLSQEELKKHFFDLSDWTVAKFLLASELATRRGSTAEAASLADETLKSLTDQGHRARALPAAIPLYVTAGRVTEARKSLDEYLGLVRAQQGSAESPRRLAGLQALVAGAENRPYAVIEALEPVMGNDTSSPGLWRLLAEAYDRTGQAGRAVKALVQYHRLNPQDQQATRELARQYAKLGDWQKAMDTAGAAESLGSTDLSLKLLSIGAAINLAAAQRDAARAEGLQKVSAELAELRQANPDQVDIRMLQAIVASHLGKLEEAESQLKLAIDECRDPLRAEVQLAGFYRQAKRLPDAIRVCEAACKRHAESAVPWMVLSDLHMANADINSARGCLKSGLNTITGKLEKRSVSIRLAVLEIVHGDRPTGIALLRDLAAQDKQEIQARSLLLGVREIQADPEATAALITELRQAEGESGLWWRLHQARAWLSSPSWSTKQQDITNLLQRCIDADPAWSTPVLFLAGMYERQGDFKKVEDVCRKGLLGNPSASDIAEKLLALLEKQGRFSDAEGILRQVQIDPRLASAWQVRMALGARDYSRAMEELKLQASNNPKDASSRIQLARLVYQETKDADQALGYLKNAEAIDPNSRMLAAVKASILRGEGKAQEALRVLDDYVKDHNDFDAHWMRATHFAEQGDLARAEGDYRMLPTFRGYGPAGYELLSNFYGGSGRPDQAVAAVEDGLKAYPDDLRLKRKLMQMLFLRGQAQDLQKALEILASLEERFPQDTELLAVRVAQILKEPNPQALGAIREKLVNALRLEPSAVGAHLALITVAMRQGDLKGACDYAVQALASNPNNPSLLSARARAELALGYIPMATKLATEALSLDPRNTEALNVMVDGALISRDRNLLEQARTVLDSALAREPANEERLIQRSHVLAGLGLPKEAVPSLEAYCKTKEGSASIVALVTLADMYRLSGDAEQAKGRIEQAERVDRGNTAVVHARFLWLVAQKRFDELTNISSAYVSAKPQDPATVLKAASALLSLDRKDLKQQAVKLFEYATTLAPASADAQLGLASSVYQTADVERAKTIYRQLLERYPNEIRALNDLAWILQEHDKQYAEALELADRGLRLAPNDRNLLDTRGTIRSNMPDRLADARTDFETLVGLPVADPRLRAKPLLQLGRVCVKLNDMAAAKRHCDEALKIDKEANIFTPAERSEISNILQLKDPAGP